MRYSEYLSLNNSFLPFLNSNLVKENAKFYAVAGKTQRKIKTATAKNNPRKLSTTLLKMQPKQK